MYAAVNTLDAEWRQMSVAELMNPPADEADDVWVNPVGGLGDILLLSSVLKLAHERDESRRFNMIAHAIYAGMFRGHPAVRTIGSPPAGATVVKSDYWSMESLGPGMQRPFQILARLFGLSTPVEEQLYTPFGVVAGASELLGNLRGLKTVVIAPSSDSPRKMAHPMHWHHIVHGLTRDGVHVVQVGRVNDVHIKGTYSLLGLTDHAGLVNVLGHADAVLAVDNYVMHLAHCLGTPSLVLWGPTASEVYGYREQIHLRARLDGCPLQNECLGPTFPENAHTPCPRGEAHCMNSISVDSIVSTAKVILARSGARKRLPAVG